MSRPTLPKIIGTIYEAVTDDAVWTVAADQTFDLLGGGAGSFDLQHQFVPLEKPSAHLLNFCDEAVLQQFEEFKSPANNIGMRALANGKLGQAFSMWSFMDLEDYRTDPSTRAILHPQHIDQALMVVLDRGDEGFGYFNIFRFAGDDTFTDQDRQAFTMLAKHYVQAIALSRRLTSSEFASRYASSFANSRLHDTGLVLLSSNGAIVDMDDAANWLLQARLGLTVVNGRLRSTSQKSSEHNEALQCFLQMASVTTKPFVIHHRQGSPLALQVYDVPANRTALHASADKVVEIRLLRTARHADASVVARAFSLTPAEEAVINALMRTQSATQAAKRLGLSRETVKTHLRSIYGKTETASLVQLMLLLGKFA